MHFTQTKQFRDGCLACIGIAAGIAIWLALRTQPLHPVEGRLVRYEGTRQWGMLGLTQICSPVSRARLRFFPDETRGNTSGLEAVATTDVQGYFCVSTPSRGQGLETGWYKVVVEDSDADFSETYRQAETTPLSVQVPRGGVRHLYFYLDLPPKDQPDEPRSFPALMSQFASQKVPQ